MGATSGAQVTPETIDFHNQFCKFSKKTDESVWYFLKVKSKIERKAKPEFVFFHINYLDADDNNRAVSCILLLFWRASKGVKSTKSNMKLASSTSAIRNSMTNISYLEAESKGDLTWDLIVAKCKSKK